LELEEGGGLVEDPNDDISCTFWDIIAWWFGDVSIILLVEMLALFNSPVDFE